MNADRTDFTLPVGYHKFHRKQLFNFQLNRWHSLGYVRYEDMIRAGHLVKDFASWKTEMLRLAQEAETDNRLMNAAFYYRAAEFYILKETVEKKELYNKFIDLFDRAFRDDSIERFEVPYQGTYLPAMKIVPSDIKKGTIVMHGGFDSFIEEFYSWMAYFAEAGYEVIAFEGPGQGGARREYDLAFDHEWEKPVAAILDFFTLDDVTLLGISMGGWLCLRAAAFESRITRVIADGHAHDYMQCMPPFLWDLHMIFFNHLRDWSNRMTLRKIEQGASMDAWFAAQLMYISKKEMPLDAFDTLLALCEENVHPELVNQDVLILSGRKDHFIPKKMHQKQLDVLTNAKSVTGRVFTKEEHAQNHCQIGNVGLALEVMVDWIGEVS
ncbi:MAG: alpha/beta hydrolase [Bacteroidales bacterium]|nr:alpha/beta hydrolase [Candidatus Latescibacterota bacterium]